MQRRLLGLIASLSLVVIATLAITSEAYAIGVVENKNTTGVSRFNQQRTGRASGKVNGSDAASYPNGDGSEVAPAYNPTPHRRTVTGLNGNKYNVEPYQTYVAGQLARTGEWVEVIYDLPPSTFQRSEQLPYGQSPVDKRNHYVTMPNGGVERFLPHRPR